MDEKVIEKIKNLIELANDGNDEEGQTALLMAQRLMLKHDVSLAQVEAFEEKASAEEESGENVVEARKKMPWWIKSLHVILASNFRCYSLTARRGDVTEVSFFGSKSDVEMVSKIYEAAVLYLNYRLKRLPDKSANYKNSYLHGFLHSLQQRFKSQVEEFGLMVLPSEKVKEDFYGLYQGIKKSSVERPNATNAEAFSAGKNDGENATILPEEIIGEED